MHNIIKKSGGIKRQLKLQERKRSPGKHRREIKITKND